MPIIEQNMLEKNPYLAFVVCVRGYFSSLYPPIYFSLGTIHLRRRQIFHDFWPLPHYRRQFFTTIHRQIWQSFDPSPPEKCRRLKWMVPYHERVIGKQSINLKSSKTKNPNYAKKLHPRALSQTTLAISETAFSKKLYSSIFLNENCKIMMPHSRPKIRQKCKETSNLTHLILESIIWQFL